MPQVHGDLMIAVISGGGVVTASANTGERYWSRRFNGSVAGQALRIGDRIVFATHHRDGEVHALDMQRGRRVWRKRLDQRPAAEPAVADGVLYLVSERGRVLALDARTGDEKWRREIGGVVVQPPVVHEGSLLVATRDTLVTLARADGQRIARHPLAGTPSAAMALGGYTLVVATQEGIVAAYDVRSGTELWRHDVGAPVLAAPAITARGVVVLNRAADVWLLDARGARRVADLEGAATESLTVTANGMLVGLLDGTLHFLDRDGRPVWSEELGASIQAPALLHEGAVLATTVNGRLVRLAPAAQMGSR